MHRLQGSVVGLVRAGRVYAGGPTIVPDLVCGRVSLPGLWLPRGCYEHNLALYGAATIIAQLLRGQPDGKPWRISALYVEFSNDSGNPVTPPAFDRSGGKSYYDGLVSDSNRDYLRVPIIAQTLGSTDENLFPGGNEITFYGQTTGTSGVHGKTFSHTVQSRVFGGALVSTPEFDDPSQDVVHSRFYFSDANNQLIKQAGSQISLTWPLRLL